MTQTYAELLKLQGATDEDLKILVTPASEKAYAAMQKQNEDSAARATKAEQKTSEYDKWYNDTVVPQTNKLMAERDTALADAAAEKARLEKLNKLGLLAIAEQAEPTVPSAKPADAPAVDLSKYVTQETMLQLAEREGDAIAIAQDIAFEHRQLFPDKPLNFRQLRAEAVKARKPVEEFWQERYGVQAARDSHAAADKAAYEKKIADDAIAKYRSENSSSNPFTASPAISSTPFTGKGMPSASDASHPWLKSEGEREQARLGKAMKTLQEKGLVQ